ncbi:MAG: hypothetical protein LBQ39_00740, partial [Tannerellaceae bacterium]|nr:hypothetical protein [Tannerellaceae bacterium]
GTANTVTKTVDIKRAAAGRFGIPTYAPNGGNLLAADAQVTVTASTNMAWHAGYKIENDNLVENKTQTVSTYSSKNLVVNVPDNPVFETRTVYVWAKIAGETSTTYSQSYTQAQATLVLGTPTGSQNIPAAGVTNSFDITIPFTGTYTGQIVVEAYDQDYQSDGIIGQNSGNNNASIGVTVDSNDDWSPRTVIFKYAADGLSGSPISIDLDYIQPAAYTVTIDGDNEYIPGKTYMFDIGSSSNCPDGTTLYFLNSAGTEVAQISTENGNTTGYQVNIGSGITGDLTINVKDKRNNSILIKTITPSYHTFNYNNQEYCLLPYVTPSTNDIINSLAPASSMPLNQLTQDMLSGWSLVTKSEITVLLPQLGDEITNENIDVHHDALKTQQFGTGTAINVIVICHNTTSIYYTTRSEDGFTYYDMSLQGIYIYNNDSMYLDEHTSIDISWYIGGALRPYKPRWCDSTVYMLMKKNN